MDVIALWTWGSLEHARRVVTGLIRAGDHHSKRELDRLVTWLQYLHTLARRCGMVAEEEGEGEEGEAHQEWQDEGKGGGGGQDRHEPWAMVGGGGDVLGHVGPPPRAYTPQQGQLEEEEEGGSGQGWGRALGEGTEGGDAVLWGGVGSGAPLSPSRATFGRTRQLLQVGQLIATVRRGRLDGNWDVVDEVRVGCLVWWYPWFRSLSSRRCRSLSLPLTALIVSIPGQKSECAELAGHSPWLPLGLTGAGLERAVWLVPPFFCVVCVVQCLLAAIRMPLLPECHTELLEASEELAYRVAVFSIQVLPPSLLLNGCLVVVSSAVMPALFSSSFFLQETRLYLHLCACVRARGWLRVHWSWQAAVVPTTSFFVEDEEEEVCR